MSQDNASTGFEIAVIGMAGRFPGAKSVEELWARVRDGVDCITTFSDADLAAAGVDPEHLRRPDYVKAGAVLSDIDLFDAEFFGFSPREAELLDPQQRLFLECAWEALENAGYAVESYAGLIGVCAGAGRNGYLQQNVYSNPELIAAAGVFQTFLNNEKDSLALRTAYQLNLGGPSLTVQTACSTSLVAVHVACQNLLAGDCDICLAGGVSIALPQTTGYIHAEGLMLSPDGRCRAFDAQGAGAVLGRGVGIVVLKRLADAIADGDSILAVVKGSAVNNDGASKIGYTAPSVEGQARVIRTAHLRAGVTPDTISFVEGHGTATKLGDPIEVAALNEAFAVGSPRPETCALGSIKSNIGHLDAAAGVAGLIKTVLALRNRQLPPSLHFTTPNPKIAFGDGPFYVNTALKSWPDGATPRRAGVSSFGMGGTNAHVVVEEAPVADAASVSHSHRLLVMSARTEGAVEQVGANLASYLRSNPHASLDDVAFTLQTGRKAFNHRRAVVCRDAADAIGKLELRDRRSLWASTAESRDRALVFMFPGQGAQYPGLARGLFDEYREFRSQVTECGKLLAAHLPGFDVQQVMRLASSDAAAEQLARTELAQTALFVVEYALARQLMAWGLAPAAMIGHSVGEFVAGCLAGVFTLDEALGLITARGRLMQALPPGGMLAVPLPQEEVAALLANTKLSIAAVNAPRLSVVSGPLDDLDAFEARLANTDLQVARLRTSHAFHSAMMDPIVDAFAERVSRAMLRAPQVPYISNVTGTWITADDATDPAYWARHLRQPVRFGDGIRRILSDRRRVLIEVGPGATLVGLARQNAAGRPVLTVQTMRRAQETDADAAVLLGALGRLWLDGVGVDFSRVHAGDRRHRVALPTYPFERKRFWVAPGKTSASTAARALALVKKPRVQDWCYVPAWKIAASPVATSAPGRWMVLADGSPVGRAVRSELSASGLDVVHVLPGDAFARSGRNTYTVDPRSRSDYDRLLADLDASGRAIDRVAHLWRVGAESGDGTGFYSLLFLVQALGASRAHQVTQLVVGTTSAQSVTGTEHLQTSDATMLGLCRVIPNEYPGLSFVTVDVEPASDEESARRMAGRIAGELRTDAADPVVAWRGYKRWVLRYAEAEMPAQVSPRWRDRGVYVITGGLGRIGLTLADRLARDAHARLVLTATSPLPPREQWDRLAGDDRVDDRTVQRIRAVLAMEQAGAEVAVEVVDVKSPEQMAWLFDATERRFGRLDGVIHAAGVTAGPSFAPIEQLDRVLCEQQFDPKVAGVRALETALAGRRLDFCLLMSSLASVLGGIGFGAYAGANQYLDAVAHAHHAQGEPWWMSANWEGWQFGASTAAAGAALALTRAEGAAAFEWLVSAPPAPQVIVSTANLTARLETMRRGAVSPREPRALTAYGRPNLPNPYVAPSTDPERVVAAIWKELLGVDRVGVHDNFFELGGHSLVATQAVSSLRAAFGGTISVSTIFEHPTVHALAQMVSGAANPVAALTRASGRGERRRDALRRLEAVE
ncbi:MAG: SDR family oxidoreductase [Vicinamibacterales bacterium]